LPVINKVDLPTADVERVRRQLAQTLGVEAEPVLTSAKTGLGVQVRSFPLTLSLVLLQLYPHLYCLSSYSRSCTCTRC